MNEKIGLIYHLAKETVDQISSKSREFFEFVLPPVDMHTENNNLIVTIDVAGFKNEDIKLSIEDNIFSINAEKKQKTRADNEIISKQRPNILDKKIRLPLRIKEGEKVDYSRECIDGILIITIPLNHNVTLISKNK